MGGGHVLVEYMDRYVVSVIGFLFLTEIPNLLVYVKLTRRHWYFIPPMIKIELLRCIIDCFGWETAG